MNPFHPTCCHCGKRHHPWELCPEFVKESTHSTTMLGLSICLVGFLLIFIFALLFKF